MQLTDAVPIFTQAIGGLGLFLLGMVIMTDALRTLAGTAIRVGLLQFTRTPTSGAITGAISTAILQSSSATTVATVGFVGASLMAFPEALGIIFGANIGTTITGWLVALLGFKLQLGSIALPLIFIGISMRLFGKGKTTAAGLALAGFALIFIGISTMQQGMTGLQGVVTPDHLPDDTLAGRLQLVAFGILFTVVTQSSSAGVATALTALFAGTINFHQAAALVIGMDVGTTITALLATIGGSVGARRTGYSHVIYNIFTAIGALILISPFVWLWQTLFSDNIVNNAEIALVAFHTTFNALGVVIVIPFTRKFANLMERLVPEKAPFYLQKLEISLLQQPTLALTEIQIVLKLQFVTLLEHLEHLLTDGKQGKVTSLHELQAGLDAVHGYIDKIHLTDENSSEWERLIELMHSLDHMQRLHERCDEEPNRAFIAWKYPQLKQQHEIMLESISAIKQHLLDQKWLGAIQFAENLHKQLDDSYGQTRHDIIKQIGRNELDVPEATRVLESVRWMRRVSRHMEQITRHYIASLEAAGK